jgi:hypothetical protein
VCLPCFEMVIHDDSDRVSPTHLKSLAFKVEMKADLGRSSNHRFSGKSVFYIFYYYYVFCLFLIM